MGRNKKRNPPARVVPHYVFDEPVYVDRELQCNPEGGPHEFKTFAEPNPRYGPCNQEALEAVNKVRDSKGMDPIEGLTSLKQWQKEGGYFGQVEDDGPRTLSEMQTGKRAGHDAQVKDLGEDLEDALDENAKLKAALKAAKKKLKSAKSDPKDPAPNEDGDFPEDGDEPLEEEGEPAAGNGERSSDSEPV